MASAKKKTVVIAVIVLLAALAAGFMYYFSTQNDTPSNETSDASIAKDTSVTIIKYINSKDSDKSYSMLSDDFKSSINQGTWNLWLEQIGEMKFSETNLTQKDTTDQSSFTFTAPVESPADDGQIMEITVKHNKQWVVDNVAVRI